MLKRMTNDELINIICEKNEREKQLLEKIETFDAEMKEMKKEFQAMKDSRQHFQNYEIGDVEKRIIDLERKLYAQEQYSRRECVEFVGINNNLDDTELQNNAISIFHKAGVEVTKRDFHAVHRLFDKSTVIAKLINRQDVYELYKRKKILRDLSDEDKTQLHIDSKLYVNESLCPAYRILLGKCNSLYKQKKIQAFYTSNGTIRIKTCGFKNDNGDLIGCDVTKIEHIYDLEALFGKDVMNTLVRKI